MGRGRSPFSLKTPTLPLYKREGENSSRWSVPYLGEGLREEREKARRRRGEEASPLFVDPGSVKFVEELYDSGSEVGGILLSNLWDLEIRLKGD